MPREFVRALPSLKTVTSAKWYFVAKNVLPSLILKEAASQIYVSLHIL